MAYQSKYTGLEIDDILDSVEWKQGKIEDLASIRAGAQKGATALQSYTEKYTGTVTGIKLNGVVKSGSGVIDLGTISTTETDPIFSASPAASITEAKKAEWDGKQDKIADLASIRSGAEKGATALQSIPSEYVTETELTNKGYATTSSLNNKVDKVNGKQLSTEDFTTALKTKLEGLSNYDDTELSNAVETLRGDFDEIVSGDTTTAIKTFNEVIAFLDGIQDTQDLSGIIASIEQQIAGKQDELISGTNIKTINGESILGEGDLTIEGGAKIYTWSPTITSIEDAPISGTFTEEEYYNILNADVLYINVDGAPIFCIARGINSENGEGILITGSQITTYADFAIDISLIKEDGVFTGTVSEPIPSKTSQLTNDSNFISSEDVAAVALSGSYNDLQDTPTIPSAVTESTVSGWGFTKNTGTYSKPSGGIPKTDLDSAVQTSLGKADTALQSYTEQYKGTVTGVKINGTIKNPSSGVVDLGTVITDVSNLATKDEVIFKDVTGELITAHIQALYGNGSVYALPDQANGDEDDILLSRNSVKTINGESIVGSGNITISGGGSSSGGSGAYAEVNHGTSDTTFTLTPNTFHIWDEVSALTLTLGSETSGVANEFLFQFNSGATATSLTLPDDIKWANDSAPTIAENMIYQVSILKGLASVLEFSNVVLISFTVDGISYQAEEGMTWEQWVYSKHNIEGYQIIDGKIINKNQSHWITTDVGGSSISAVVGLSAVISDGHEYGILSTGGGGAGN